MPFFDGVFNRAVNAGYWVGGALAQAGGAVGGALAQAGDAMDDAMDRGGGAMIGAMNGAMGYFEPSALNNEALQIRVNELAVLILACNKDLQMIRERQPWVMIPKSANMLPLTPLVPEEATSVPSDAEGLLVSQSQEFQEIIDRRDILHKNLIDFNKNRPWIMRAWGYTPLEQEIMKTADEAARVLSQVTEASKELEEDQYDKDLKKYVENPSCENAAKLQESIVALLRTENMAREQHIDLNISVNELKKNLEAVKQTLVAQYTQDLQKYKDEQSYSNAMALRVSATPLFRTEQIGKQYNIDLQMDDMQVEIYSQAANNTMINIRNEIKNALYALQVPENMEFGTLEILERRVAILSAQIDEVVSIHLSEMDAGRSLPKELEEIITWNNFCVATSKGLYNKLMEENKKAFKAELAQKWTFSSLIDRISSIIRRFQRIIALLTSLGERLAGRESLAPTIAGVPMNNEYDELILQISECAGDLATLQMQSKALEKASEARLPEAVAIMIETGCGPASKEVIARRDALQKALEEFNELKKLKEKEPGYKATDLERAIANSTKMLEELNAAIEEFAVFDPEMQQRCKEFNEAYTQYLTLKDRFNNNKPHLRIRPSIELEKMIHQDYYNGRNSNNDLVKVPGIKYAASRLRGLGVNGYCQFRTAEAAAQDKADIDGIIIDIASTQFYRESFLFLSGLKSWVHQPDYNHALALQESADRLLQMQNTAEKNYNRDFAQEHNLDMDDVKKVLDAVNRQINGQEFDAEMLREIASKTADAEVAVEEEAVDAKAAVVEEAVAAEDADEDWVQMDVQDAKPDQHPWGDEEYELL